MVIYYIGMVSLPPTTSVAACFHSCNQWPWVSVQPMPPAFVPQPSGVSSTVCGAPATILPIYLHPCRYLPRGGVSLVSLGLRTSVHKSNCHLIGPDLVVPLALYCVQSFNVVCTRSGQVLTFEQKSSLLPQSRRYSK